MSRADVVMEIDFYDDPNDLEQRTPVSVTGIEGTNGRGCALLFDLFYKKVLDNLGYCPARSKLEETVKRVIGEGLSKQTDIVHGSDYSLELVERHGKPTKKIKASFCIPTGVKTRFSWGGEDYYAPMGIFAMLQSIIDMLDEEELVILDSSLNDVL